METLSKECESLIGNGSGLNAGDRRSFMRIALGAGFAAAALPIAAQTVVKTDSKGLTAGELEVDVKDGKLAFYRAQPEGKSGLPVVLVVSEIFGVHEHIADVCRRFAKQGYLAIAPDLFSRQGDVNAYSSIPELMKEVVSKVPDQQVLGDLDACVAWAGSHGGDVSRLAVTGFCWGGRITWLYAAHNPKVRAAAAWYGRIVGDHTALQPSQPIDLAATLKTPVLGLYGAKDGGIPVADVERMKEALGKAGNGSEFVIYPNSGHAFHADYRASYVEADAKDGWQRCLAWFKQHGVV